MRKFSFSAALLLSVVVFPATAAWADDGEPESTGSFYGNLHGSFGVDENLTNSVVYVPYLNMGGKFAYDDVAGSFGAQFDLDYKYADFAFISPKLSGVKGNQSEIDTAAHLTYLQDDDKKIGFFGGYSSRASNYYSVAGVTPNYFSVTGLQRSEITYGVAGLGAEGLFAVGADTSMQVRAAILMPAYLNGVLDTGAGPVTQTGIGPDFSKLGYMVAAGASHQIGSNISARLDASYANFSVKDLGTNVSELNTSVSAQYSLESLPLSLGMTWGYVHETVQGAGSDGIYSTAKMTYSFGGPSQGAHGKLFRSGLLGWAN
jgi:hypothetical protein